MGKDGPAKGRRKWLPITRKRRQLHEQRSHRSQGNSSGASDDERLSFLLKERDRLKRGMEANDAALSALLNKPDEAQSKKEMPKPSRLKIPKVAAVPVSRSVTPEYIVCLIDGERRKMLHRYLKARYVISPEEYRKHFGLPSDYPMTAPGYSAQKSVEAMQQGLGHNRVKLKT